MWMLRIHFMQPWDNIEQVTLFSDINVRVDDLHIYYDFNIIADATAKLQYNN